MKQYFTVESGGKQVISVRRVGLVAGGSLLALAVLLAWFGPGQENTFYVQTTVAEQQEGSKPNLESGVPPSEMQGLFSSGQQQRDRDSRELVERNRKRVQVKYYAPQLIGGKHSGAKAMRAGSKLIGVLTNPIDTRSPARVQVKVVRGGESGGVEIETGSVLSGTYSYPGDGPRVFMNFSEIETPDGDLIQIQAQALDSNAYTAGINGKLFSGTGIKVASRLGFQLLSGMADVMTEKESLGPAANGVQAKSTMKNGLLQGVSRAAQDQTNRTASDIDSVPDYVVLEKGTEIIIELVEEYKK